MYKNKNIKMYVRQEKIKSIAYSKLLLISILFASLTCGYQHQSRMLRSGEDIIGIDLSQAEKNK